MTLARLLPLLALVLLATGCGADEQAPSPPAEAPQLLLSADFPDAIPVIEAKKLESGQQVTLFGRVRDVLRGYAAFTLIDDVEDYCGRGVDPMPGCPTPWDYCCTPQEDVIAGSLPVEVRGPAGGVLKASSGDIRLLDLVALRGTLEKTESGSLILVAEKGWYRRERPKLADNVEWPDG